jgi:hypothetical protein
MSVTSGDGAESEKSWISLHLESASGQQATLGNTVEDKLHRQR